MCSEKLQFLLNCLLCLGQEIDGSYIGIKLKRDSSLCRRYSQSVSIVVFCSRLFTPAMDQALSGQRRFSGSGHDPSADYKAWKRWATAFLIVQKSEGVKEEAFWAAIVKLARRSGR